MNKVVDINDLRDDLGIRGWKQVLWILFVIFTIMGGFVILAVLLDDFSL